MPRSAKLPRPGRGGRPQPHPQIFVGYAREDRSLAEALVEGLGATGFRVWWDGLLRPGDDYQDAIDRALDVVECVIVIWSTNSVASRWVRDEADEGLKKRILIPIRGDDSKIPLGFRGLQTCSVAGLPLEQLSTRPPTELLESIERLIGRPVR
jgi:hypothetical protein